MRKKPINLNCLVGYSSISLLGLLLLALLLPHAPSSSHASSCLDDPTIEGCYTTMAETEVGVTASTAISLAMSSQVNMEVIPKSNGATSSASTKLSVSTNSPDGYALYMQTGSTPGDLVSTATLSESKITNTTKSNVTLNNLEPNAYGYALTEGAINPSTTYSSLPTTGSVIKKTTSVTASEGNYAYGDTYNLAFGVNVTTTLPAGTYTGSVLISAVANPKTIATMFDLTYMQDMTSGICTNTREGYTKQLVDTRDGKSYWVAKLKDGNCWMTQNLAYTITQEMIDNNSINSTNTDLHPNNPALTGAGQLYTDETTGITYWNNNEAVTYKPTVSRNSTIGSSSDIGTNSWNLGQFVILNPESTVPCVADLTEENQSSAISFRNNQTFDQCVNAVNVTDWSPTFTAQEKTIARQNFVRKTVSGYDAGGTTTKIIYIPLTQTGTGTDKDTDGAFIPYTYTGLVTADFENQTYDSHYLVGNYYQFNTITAGTAGQFGNRVTLPSTICPKGWTLPSVSSTNGTWKELMDKYSDSTDFLQKSYLSRSGIVNYSGFLSSFGYEGKYTTKTTSVDYYLSDLYKLSIMGETIKPREEGWGRANGYSARCLAR